MRARSSRCSRVREQAIVALCVLILLAAVGIALPTGAPAEQASAPTSAAAGHLDAGGYHNCAVLVSANLRCWGFSGNGQLGYADRSTIGDDETPGSAGPVNLGPGRTVVAVATGDFHTCALLSDEKVRCWGYAFDGQLGYGNRLAIGDDEAPGSVGPVDLGTGRTAKAISAGGRHTCALLDNGDVRCWGLGADGQLGYGNTVSGTAPPNIGDNETPAMVATVDLGRPAVAISAGNTHTCAGLDDGSVRCWGYGGTGALGYGNTSNVGDDETPRSAGAVNVGPGGRTAKAISAGDFHTCAVLDDGSVRCWGAGGDGELGYGNREWIGDTEPAGSVGPVDLAGHTAAAISAGRSHTCAVLDDGSVRCWGLAGDGRLGYGNKRYVGDDEAPGSVGPVNLGAGRTALAVSAGPAQTCARLDDGSVLCWGDADSGRLGYCNTDDVGDDETPGSVGPLALETPGAACPRPDVGGAGGGAGTTPDTGSTQTGGGGFAGPVTPTSQAGAGSVDPLAVQALRARDMRTCLARAKRLAARKRDIARRSCLKRYGRTPGRIDGLRARAAAKTKVVLSFTAPGSDGSRPPAARSYVVKQSPTPIRGARDFVRARTLRNTSFEKLTRVGAKVKLTITDLRPKTTYYYAIAAQDNVSNRLGPRSAAVKATTR